MMKTNKPQQTASIEQLLNGTRNNFLKLKSAIKRTGILVVAMTLVLALSFSTPSNASPLSSSDENNIILQTTNNTAKDTKAVSLKDVDAGLQLAEKVLKIYRDLNPGQQGYVQVLNKLNRDVTVRSYNNNDWFKAVAAGQTYLKAGGQGYITAVTDPVALIWKRGNYGNLDAFGTRNIGQSVAPKGPKYVFVIGEENTP